jgi:hypothetical protein
MIRKALTGDFDITKATHRIYIDDRDARLASEYGVNGLVHGWNDISYERAKEIIGILRRTASSASYKKTEKRVLSIAKQITFSFGPDFEAEIWNPR